MLCAINAAEKSSRARNRAKAQGGTMTKTSVALISIALAALLASIITKNDIFVIVMGIFGISAAASLLRDMIRAR
jgi:hypothetical protein